MRHIGWVVAATLAPALVGAGASADGLRREVVVAPTAVSPLDVVPNKIFLNRCVGGCTIRHGTTNDARTHTSTIPAPATSTLTEWAWGDQEWNDLVQCVKEVYSPYGVTVTDVQPDVSEDYNEAVIAGLATELGLSDNFGGIAPIAPGCQVVDHGLSFSFANAYTATVERVHEICWTAAQEVGHTYGLDHEYEFYDHTSACNDPMTYRDDCGGQKFFRNKTAHCGEYSSRDCLCSLQQNDHKWLTTQLGAGTPITTGMVSISSPAQNDTIGSGAVVHATASAQRGVATVQLVLNGYKWLEVPGVAFGQTGQPAADYQLALPADVPDSIIDIQVIEKDDLDISATSTVTVTKGAPCVTADTCAKGQQCAAGKCFWDPPAGELGDACDYPQFCKSGRCETVDHASYCTQDCSPSDSSTCPMGLECLASTPDTGMCWPPSSGGCCSSGRGGPAWVHFGLSALVLGIAIRRRRRA